ncbi:uncharacterized protein CLUP02_17600 [Colletotrichum lupini]|uniref:Uncharacterized protein n=1 Tax=Colletotrichum lupini TaxID=145971 RepID=A0A9Q8WAD7_9PEZI|nr:uncharacterized protein CLUP02_17600 [Colletotrichum lupini]UQC76089.1 hypothetical protein CLUP02_17600 [Colletotrichum lupini]
MSYTSNLHRRRQIKVSLLPLTIPGCLSSKFALSDFCAPIFLVEGREVPPAFIRPYFSTFASLPPRPHTYDAAWLLLPPAFHRLGRTVPSTSRRIRSRIRATAFTSYNSFGAQDRPSLITLFWHMFYGTAAHLSFPVLADGGAHPLAKRHAALSCHGYGNFIIAPCSQRLQKPIEHQVSSQSSYPQIELRTQSCTSGSAVMVCPPVPCPQQQRPPVDSSEGRDMDRRPHLVDPGLVNGAFKGLAYTYPCNNGFWYQKTAQENDAEALTGRTRSRRKQCVLQEFSTFLNRSRKGLLIVTPSAPESVPRASTSRSSLRQSDRVAGSKFSDCWYADTLHVHLHFTGPIARRCAWLVLTPALSARCIASTTKHLQKESWHITVGGNAACSDMACRLKLIDSNSMPIVHIFRHGRESGSLDGKDHKLGDTFESCNDHPATVPVDSTSMYGARISEARQMFEGTLTTLLNPKRIYSSAGLVLKESRVSHIRNRRLLGYHIQRWPADTHCETKIGDNFPIRRNPACSRNRNAWHYPGTMQMSVEWSSSSCLPEENPCARPYLGPSLSRYAKEEEREENRPSRHLMGRCWYNDVAEDDREQLRDESLVCSLISPDRNSSLLSRMESSHCSIDDEGHLPAAPGIIPLPAIFSKPQASAPGQTDTAIDLDGSFPSQKPNGKTGGGSIARYDLTRPWPLRMYIICSGMSARKPTLTDSVSAFSFLGMPLEFQRSATLHRDIAMARYIQDNSQTAGNDFISQCKVLESRQRLEEEEGSLKMVEGVWVPNRRTTYEQNTTMKSKTSYLQPPPQSSLNYLISTKQHVNLQQQQQQQQPYYNKTHLRTPTLRFRIRIRPSQQTATPTSRAMADQKKKRHIETPPEAEIGGEIGI